MRQASLIHRPKNPQANSNFLSILTFWYTLKIFYKARKRDFDEDNLTQPLEEHESCNLGEKLAVIWSEEVERAKYKNRLPRIRKALYKCFKWQIFQMTGVAMFLEIFVKVSLPIFLKLVLRYYSTENKKKINSGSTEEIHTYFMRIVFIYDQHQGPIHIEEAIFFTLGLVFSNWLIVAFSHPYLMGVMHLGMKMRVACCSLIYRKALRLKIDSTIIGNAINLLSNDVNRFDNGVMFLPYMVLTPIQIAVITFFLYKETGFAAIFGILALILVMPLEIWLSVRLLTLRYLAALKTDERVKQMSELLEAIQVIKMYTWEHVLMDIIYRDRAIEIKYLRKMGYIKGTFMSFIIFSFRFSIFIISVGYILMGKHITAEKIFVITSFLLILRQSVCVFLPQALACGAELMVSLLRIEEFLHSDEAAVGDPTPLNPNFSNDESRLEGFERKFKRAQSDPEEIFLKITNASAKFDNEIVLKNINLVANPGALTVIIGPVGSGKSCFLHLILGELPKFEGNIDMEGIVSYASQEPWLFPGSIRQNILLGREYNRRRYEEVCFVCALSTDFNLLPHGDKTLVGERGNALSGGQRARVNLARAIYKEADIYLLDDPLSAVDTNVGKHLFEECINGYIAEKVVILVTHQLQYVENADQIVLMKNGVIEAIGDYEYLKGAGLIFSILLAEQLIDTGRKMEKSTAKERKSSVRKALTEISGKSISAVTFIDKDNESPAQPKQEKEFRSEGKVDFSVYKQYFKASAYTLVVPLMFTLFLVTQLLASSADLFIAEWINMEESGSNIISRNACITIYTCIIVACIIVALGRSFYFSDITMAASKNLHDSMFRGVVETRMHFFHKFGPGTILNRFSKDLGAIDELLPNAMMDSIQICLNLVGVILVLGIINPYFLLPTFLICTIFLYLRNFFMKVSSNLKRLESIARSPAFAHVNSTFQGLATIRSNGAEHILTSEFDSHQDIHSSAWFMYIATSRAFGYWLDSICILYIAIIAFSFMFSSGDDEKVGLAITQMLNLTGMIQWGIRQSAELGNQMVSVERVVEYTKLEPEPNLLSDPMQQPPPDWPTSGTVEFSHAYMKYGPLDAHVLRDVSFFIQDKEKVGIVGRTGAGKSSLIAAMFRLAYFFGEVRIDNLDIGQLCLHDLRRKISIIPQEPVLFAGSLLYNLDPYGEYDKDFIMEVLIGLENKDALAHGKACLHHVIVEGGANVSVGERQIICLARALLRNNKIIVMDEATANIDAQTDKFIQSVIRSKFSNCTVITVAHRLHTIMDSDKVLVMDAGQVAEFDHPYILLQNSSSIFAKMVEKTGEHMADSLKSMAKRTYDSRNDNIV